MSRFDLLERYGKPTLLGWQGVHTQTSNGKDCDVTGIARKKFRASAAKTKKRTDRPALIQLAQLCDILADGIEAELRADASHNSN